MKCPNCGFEILDSNAKFCPKCGTKTVAPVVEAVKATSAYDISSVWPEWQIEKQLGKGSFGVVYQAVRKDSNVESHAAIKVVSIPSDSSEVDSLRSEGLDLNGTKTYFKGIVDDFVNEIQLMESMKGMQNIVSVEDYKVVEKTDVIGWDIYIRMELLTPFSTYSCDKVLTEADVIKLGIDICTALEVCSQRNIIHRDIKPENIFINDFGYYKLGDFGIARKLENMTGGLSQKGTYNYMAPEVANSKEYDARVDTYSLGIVLYRLLNNNRLPFLNSDKQILNPNERKAAVERRIRGEQLPAPCNASPAMANIILKACAYNPAVRFASATEMKNALLAVQKGATAVVSDLDATAFVTPAQQIPATPANAKPPVATYNGVNPADKYNAPKKEKKQMSKGKKAKIISLAVLIGILVLAVTLVVSFFTSSAYNVYKDMKDEQYSSALSEYRTGVKDNFIQEALMDALLKNYGDEIVNRFKSGEIDYDSAVDALEALEKMGYENTTDKLEQVDVVNNASNALEKGDEYYENGDIANAIAEYSKIPEDNENYAAAQKKINELCPQYVSSVVKTVQQYNSQRKYKDSLSYLNTAYAVLPSSANKSDLDSVKAETIAYYKEQVASEVADYINNSQYVEAFNLINEATALSDDTYFAELRTSTEAKYVEYITNTVQAYLDQGDYISAKRVVDTALTVLPDNVDLADLGRKVTRETPTYLLDVLTPYSSSDYKAYINGETMQMGGNAYTNGFTLTPWSGTGNAVFNIDAKYTTLSFIVGHIDNTRKESATIKIYCDGILKKEFSMNAEALPQKITVDITGVKQLKFEMSTYEADYGFANVTVK